MRRALASAITVGVLTVSPSLAAADPSHNVQLPQTLSCDNGQTIVVNPGTLTNRSHQAFVIDSTSIFVVNSLTFTDASGSSVLWDTASGLSNLITCTGDAGGGVTITAQGFLTPRA
jgi:hypothetical protein